MAWRRRVFGSLERYFLVGTMVSGTSSFAFLEEEEKIKHCDKALKEMKSKLNTFRAQHRMQVPPIMMKRENDKVQFKFQYPTSADVLKMINGFSSNLQRDGKILEIHSSSDEFLAFQFTDQSGSILLHKDPNGPHYFSFYKSTEDMTNMEIQAIVDSYKSAWTPSRHHSQQDPRRIIIQQRGSPQSPQENHQTINNQEEAINALEKMGVTVFKNDSVDPLDWDSMAGYESVKEEIRDTLVLALQNPQVYEEIAKQTRKRYESNRPRAVLFEGPPGTGKTLSARIIAQEAGVVMVHIPVESVVSKWYGESEKNMSAIFEACSKLDGGAIIFIDEIDALATDRGTSGGIHEVTRRMLSVLLQKIEGFELNRNTTVVCATNRKQDLDSALLSRFGMSIRFDLPDEASREGIFMRYAKHLSSADFKTLSEHTNGLSCRDIKEICQHTERKWASKLLRKQTKENLPSLNAYISTVDQYNMTTSNQSVNIYT